MTKKQKIFVSAYACEPNLGSEIGVGWHWILEMSKYFDLWVLTRESNRRSIDRWFDENRIDIDNQPTFLYYDLPKRWRWWKSGLRGVRIYYTLWQSFSDKIVKRTMQDNEISIYHHLTYGNALWGVSRYGQKQRFIWGPTSAGNSIEREFSRHYGFKARLKEWVQRVLVATLHYNIGYKTRCRDAALILCKTEQTRLLIPEEDRAKAVVFTDVATESFVSRRLVCRRDDQCVRYLAVGRLDGWRGFDLLIEAMAQAVQRNDKLRLDILGDGVDMQRLRGLIRRYNLQNSVSLKGFVSRDDYYQYMADCDVVVNPSLKEGAVTTAFDSLSFAKPLICIETGGYTRYFSDDYAVVLPRESRETIINDLSSAIIRMGDAQQRETLATNIIAARENFTWSRKGVEIRDIIRGVCIE